ncbi:hypothetical protein FFI97_027005 [Variovorax sp. KBS0712]|uniref:hypothetical protein n=1 Tax=Variovorax sp. KBS0712 TaxID=2578111 RepID=UPI001119BD2D|nr:hypothetical protein [Variovorax sp. KBS0712]TSD55001.1 hypothetical protein FFI97_027005 [Variovorax sp. KBS0712]
MPTPSAGTKKLEQLVVKNIPRDALMAFEDAYYAGDHQGRQHSAAFAPGHKPSIAGQNKHFFINETFHEALLAHGAEPTPLCGTRLVVGRLGIFSIVRLNVPGHKWINLRRSATRIKLAEVNDNINRKYVQADLFAQPREVSAGTIFILGVMDGVDTNGIAQLTEVMVSLPAPDMKSWLYINTMTDFIKLYDQTDTAVQPDTAVPKLKAQPKKKTGDDQGNQ